MIGVIIVEYIGDRSNREEQTDLKGISISGESGAE